MFSVLRGSCRPLFIFEVGQSIDLDLAERRIASATGRQSLTHRGRVAQVLEYRPAPLMVSEDLGQTDPALSLGLGPRVDLVLYDFGAGSVSYEIPLAGRAERMLELGIALRDHAGLIADARRRMARLVESLGPAVQRPKLAEVVEDYCIFQVEEVEGRPEAEAFCAEHGGFIARLLRGERSQLSPDEVRDVLTARTSYGLHDVTFVDWESALILDSEPRELTTVLEFANVQLLELRYLDRQLDLTLERSYQMIAQRIGWRALLPASFSGDLRTVAELQVEGAILLERVSNALKFLGEEYLARLYRLVARRLSLPDWDASITRKIATLESLYQKLSDRAATRRMELLEWIVILLIAAEIVLGLLERSSH